MIAPERLPQVTFKHDPAYAARQRVLDVTIAATALAVAAPILGLAALAIKLDDGGPILFKQQRVGRYGRLFTILKLRTMKTAASADALSPDKAGDSRITRVGKILRKTSVDELPQLINVLRGDMAIVGPRPEMPFIVRKYLPWQHLRLLAKPGITGLWQTSVRSRVPLHKPEATHIDLEYIRTASTTTDGRIVFKTFRVLVSTQGAY